ncbi:MAG TPA: phenylalanine--tRNA ligase subunit beta [Pyrinomonadaceae bacterium]|nr:phenylalanine--tRNA ligase subunit beta [Pyrinomonadaceae bacterium]
MNISYNWLRELSDVALEPAELARRMTMIGLAVDSVEEAGDDFVLDFDLTSNRPDCLSHLGLAREASALEGGRVNLPALTASAVEGRAGSHAAVEIHDPDLCPRYAARVVRGVKIGPSPSWLAERLQAIGQRPINNVADITNYVMHELGQPLHAFDLATLAERRIVVRRARLGEKLKTLDGVERVLDAEMLVIADAARAVALAGVMGGEETEISEATTDVLIESAYFSPASVRRTSKVLGLQTEASYRFERGTDYEGVGRAQDRCVALICDLAGGTATEDAIDVYPRPIEPRNVSLRPRRVEALTGLRVPSDDCVRILNALGFETRGGQDASDAVRDSKADGLDAPTTYSVPSWRMDVALEEDLVEEVARHFGYDKIADALPSSGASGEYLEGEARRRAARLALVSLGFDEAISFSFIEPAHDGQLELLPGLASQTEDAADAFVTLVNPIVEGWTRMRATLLPGLLGAARHNFNHGTRDLSLFEMGRVFAAGREADGLPLEEAALALLLTGVVEARWDAAPREADFYDLKGALEAAVDAMNLPPLEFKAAGVPHLREGQAARVHLGGDAVGSVGRLSEEIAASYKFKQPVYVAEVNLGALLRAEGLAARYASLARYPSVVRDASLVVDRAVPFAEMRRVVHDLGIAECRDVTLVDVYEGANMPAGKRSVTLRAEYRADDRTLRDEDVDAMHARAVGALERDFGAQLRG